MYHKGYKKKYRKENAESISVWKKNWRAENRERISVKKKEKYKNDPMFRLSAIYRKAVRQAFIRAAVQQSIKSIDPLGCTLDEFKAYLDDNIYGFKVGNAGLDLDHIRHISQAKTEKEIIKLSHYTNFQLLPSAYNRNKKRNRDFNKSDFESFISAYQL